MTSKSVRNLNIREFDPSILEKRRLNGSSPTILLLGKRGSGKSTLGIDLVWNMKDIALFIAMSETEEGNHFYRQYFHPLTVHGEYKAEIVNNIIKKQKEKLRKCDKEGIDTDKRPDLGVGLLLDDCGFKARKLMSSPDISQIFQNGRHWKICFIVCLQYMMGLPPEARVNVDFVFALKENIIANQKKLYDCFFGIFPKFAQFQETFNACTNDYECLVLDNTSKSGKITDCIFWYKATPGRKFKIGSPALWDYLNSRYDPKKEEEESIEPVRNSGISISKVPMHKLADKNEYPSYSNASNKNSQSKTDHRDNFIRKR
jgi:hypothetical protein